MSTADQCRHSLRLPQLYLKIPARQTKGPSRNMPRLPQGTSVFLLLCCTLAVAQARELLAQSTSSLWGRNGELYKSLANGGRLIDYSYAGYNAGETGLPTLKPTHNVRDFGAKGDGKTDDSAAFQRAGKGLKEGDVLYIPAGRYKISTYFEFNQGVSVLGDGSGKTELIVMKGAPLAIFMYKGKIVNTNTKITDVTLMAKKGTNDITVKSSDGVKVGEWVVVTMGTPNGGNLFLNMNNGVDKGCDDVFCKAPYAFLHYSRVAAINGNRITLERAFNWDLESSFGNVELHAWRPTCKSFGVKGIYFNMQSGHYKGHMKETGFVAVKMDGAANGFVKDIRCTDCDIAVQIARSTFMTIADILLTETPGRLIMQSNLMVSGHHGITVAAIDSLIQNWDIRTRFIHDVGNDKFGLNQVFQHGKGLNSNLDCHKSQNYANLYTDIDIGQGTRALDGSGAQNRGDHAGTYTTYWNIRTSTGKGWKSKYFRVPGFGPYLNFVGVQPGSYFPNMNTKETKSWFVEKMSPAEVYPQNIYTAMKAMRMSSPNKVCKLLGGKGNGGKILSQQ